MNPAFDFAGFLAEHFGTPKTLIGFLRAYGYRPPNEAAVSKWFQRGQVPAPWLPILLAYLELDTGEPVRLFPYLSAPPCES